MKRLNETILAKYYDGELTDKARREVEALLETSDESKDAVLKMSQLSDCMEVLVQDGLENVSFEGMDKRILNELNSQKHMPSAGERFKIWLSEFFTYKKMVWIPAASAVGAAAALVLMLPLFSGTSVPANSTPRGQETWQASVQSVSVGSQAVLANGDQVRGTEYSVINDRGESIGVVWIND